MNSPAFDLGVSIGLVEHGWTVEQYDYIKGAADILSKDNGVLGRRIINSAHEVMCLNGEEKSAAAIHLHSVANAPEWTSHGEDVLGAVIDSLIDFGMEKKALEGPGEILKDLGEVGATTSILGGAGVDSLYWLLNRGATTDDDAIKQKQEQADNYRALNQALKARLASKYNFVA